MFLWLEICRWFSGSFIIYGIVFQVISEEPLQRFYKQFERHFYKKISVTMIPEILLQIDFCYFFVLLQKPEIRIKFSASWLPGTKKHFHVFFFFVFFFLY